MFCHGLLLALVGLFPGVEPPESALIQGMVVNGSQGGTPVAGAEVVLRAGKDNRFRHIASTITDANGHFVFDSRNLTPTPGLVYIPGANWAGVHYPGPHVQLDSQGAPPQVNLTVYDAVASPSPLVEEVHEINIKVQTGVLEVTEIIVVDNPTLATYVGTADPAAPKKAPTTLLLSIPEHAATVTFNKEVDARSFQVAEGGLATTVPWPPGKRQLAFKYQLPVENNQLVFTRSLDLPCLRARLAVRGKPSRELVCNLARVSDSDAEPVGFESTNPILPAGYTMQLQIRELSLSWIAHARWTAVFLLGGLLAVTVFRMALRNRAGRTPFASAAALGGAGPSSVRIRQSS